LQVNRLLIISYLISNFSLLNLWEHLKSIVYAQLCNMQEDLWKATEANGTPIRNIFLTSVTGTGILGATGLSYALAAMVGRLNFIVKPLRAGQMQFCSQGMNSLSTTTLFVYFLHSYFLLPYLANEAVATMYIIDSACL
jgi:hypothetical protein